MLALGVRCEMLGVRCEVLGVGIRWHWCPLLLAFVFLGRLCISRLSSTSSHHVCNPKITQGVATREDVILAIENGCEVPRG